MSTTLPTPKPEYEPTREMPASRDALPLGTRLDEYEIEAVLGEGGFGIVYLATDHALQRLVAIKEFLPAALAARGTQASVSLRAPGHADSFERGLRSFVKEARLLARFDHPSLVRVHRFWEANRTAYMVMPYYEGDTLLETRKGMVRPPDEAWLREMLEGLSGALEVLHAASCVHRDIAPDNILLLPDGRPVLLDFGAARHVIGEPGQALTAVLKPSYAPIEQYAEETDLQQGPWTDLYALAAVARYCIVGRPPAPSTVRAVRDTVEPLSEAVKSLRKTWPDLHYSESLLAAIDRALAVKPEDRPQNVAQFRASLALPAIPPAAATAQDSNAAASIAPPAAMAPPAAPLRPRREFTDSPETVPAVARFSAPVQQTGPDNGQSAPDDATMEANLRAMIDASIGRSGRESKAPEAGPPGGFARPGVGAGMPEGAGAPAMPGSGMPSNPPPLSQSASWAQQAHAPRELRFGDAAPRLDPMLSALVHDANKAADPVRADRGSPDPARWRSVSWIGAAIVAAVALFGWHWKERLEADKMVMAVAAATRPGSSNTPASEVSERTAPAAPTQMQDSPPLQGGTASGAAPLDIPNTATRSGNRGGEETAAETAAQTAARAPVETPAQTPAQAPTAAAPEPPAKKSGADTTSARTAAAAAREPGSPREVCSPRTEFSLYYCMQTQCKQPRFASHPQCRLLRERDIVD